jgi:hypothetical protein
MRGLPRTVTTSIRITGQGQNWETILTQHPDAVPVIVAQECDIAQKPQIEPSVEAMPAYWTSDRALIHSAGRNSNRYFLLGRDGQRGFIADATRRLFIDKVSLVEQTGVSYEEVLHTLRERQAFAFWLARRYERPAIDDRIVDLVQKPVVADLRATDADDDIWVALGKVKQVRFQAAGPEAPDALNLLLLVSDDLSEDEKSALTGKLSRPWTKPMTLGIVDFAKEEEISLADFLDTIPMPLDEFSEELEQPPKT